ncbi:unnamed protein product [Anisakis simplex]|uniref:Regulatory-associated protein of mTOR (inferred by orthology to a human protein) n=1 Tax=Anisakis simplex TaxID=6269 RepID=A0A0M3K726_ANISI|nr:unnamed protein product [Anisakis simplex]
MYFIQILNDPHTNPRQKIVPAYVTAALIENNYKPAQELLTENRYVTLCIELLSDTALGQCRLLRLWLLIGLGRLWADHNDARWQAIRLVAYERVLEFLDDSVPEVRAAAVYSLGCLIDHEVCDKLSAKCTFDGSVLVRAELVVAMQWFIIDFENRFANLTIDLDEKIDRLSSEGRTRKTSAGDQGLDSVLLASSEEDHRERMKNLANSGYGYPFFIGTFYVLIEHVEQLACSKHRRLSSTSHLPNRPPSRTEDKTEVAKDVTNSASSTRNNAPVTFTIGSPVLAAGSSMVGSSCTPNGHIRQLSESSTMPEKTHDSSKSRLDSPSIPVFHQSAIFTPKRNKVHRMSPSQYQHWSRLILCLGARKGQAGDGLSDRLAVKSMPSDWAFHKDEGLLQTAKQEIQALTNMDVVCDMHILNEMTRELLMTGSDNGMIRVWDPCYSIHSHEFEAEPCMITAAYLLKDVPRVSTDKPDTTVYSWNQQSGRILTSGNVRLCRIWDTHAEQTAQDIPIGTKSCLVTKICSDDSCSELIALGLNDGSVNLYDPRIPTKSQRVMVLRELQRKIVGLSFISNTSNAVQTGAGLRLVAGSADGELRVWEPRMFQEPVVQLNACEELKGKEMIMPKMEVQPSGQLMGCATVLPAVRIFDVSGKQLTDIRYSDTFMSGAKHGLPTALRFHQLRVSLAVATKERFISAYGMPND